MKKSLLATGTTLAALALALTACAQAPGTSTPSGSETPSGGNSSFKACMVSDQGGFDDKSFNQTSYQGLVKAVSDFGIQSAKVQSTAATDYANNVNSMVQAGCNIIIGVGFNLEDAVVSAANANPNIKFAIVDDLPATVPTNLKPLVFNTNESAFLGGYLAAAITKSGIVGTYGGANYPTVQIYMDGYAEGVAYYNQQKSASVKVLGWDVASQQGTFVQSTSPFTDVAAGKTAAQNQVSQGADVLFPVAGNAGTGALQVAQASNGAVSAIWVDTDGCVSAADFCSVMPTSVFKAMDVAVYQAIEDAMNGNFSSTPYIGTLANQGTGIAPFHDWASKIPASTQSELTAIEQQIIAGTLTVPSKNAFTA